jgi:hypothetical protein
MIKGQRCTPIYPRSNSGSTQNPIMQGGRLGVCITTARLCAGSLYLDEFTTPLSWLFCLAWCGKVDGDRRCLFFFSRVVGLQLCMRIKWAMDRCCRSSPSQVDGAMSRCNPSYLSRRVTRKVTSDSDVPKRENAHEIMGKVTYVLHARLASHCANHMPKLGPFLDLVANML